MNVCGTESNGSRLNGARPGRARQETLPHRYSNSLPPKIWRRGLVFRRRPTVSQAIRILVVRGLVESRRGSGTYVTRRPEARLATTVGLMLDLDQESGPHL